MTYLSDNSQIFTETISLKTFFERVEVAPSLQEGMIEYIDTEKHTLRLKHDENNSFIEDMERGAIFVNGNGYTDFLSQPEKQPQAWIASELGISAEAAEAIFKMTQQILFSLFSRATNMQTMYRPVINITKSDKEEILFDLVGDNVTSSASNPEEDGWKQHTQLANTKIKTQFSLSKESNEYCFLFENDIAISSRNEANVKAIAQTVDNKASKGCLDAQDIEKDYKSVKLINNAPYNLTYLFEKQEKLTADDLQPIMSALNNRCLVVTELVSAEHKDKYVALSENDVYQIRENLKKIDSICQDPDTKKVLEAPVKLANKLLNESNQLISPYKNGLEAAQAAQAEQVRKTCLEQMQQYAKGVQHGSREFEIAAKAISILEGNNSDVACFKLSADGISENATEQNAQDQSPAARINAFKEYFFGTSVNEDDEIKDDDKASLPELIEEGNHYQVSPKPSLNISSKRKGGMVKAGIIL